MRFGDRRRIEHADAGAVGIRISRVGIGWVLADRRGAIRDASCAIRGATFPCTALASERNAADEHFLALRRLVVAFGRATLLRRADAVQAAFAGLGIVVRASE